MAHFSVHVFNHEFFRNVKRTLSNRKFVWLIAGFPSFVSNPSNLVRFKSLSNRRFLSGWESCRPAFLSSHKKFFLHVLCFTFHGIRTATAAHLHFQRGRMLELKFTDPVSDRVADGAIDADGITNGIKWQVAQWHDTGYILCTHSPLCRWRIIYTTFLCWAGCRLWVRKARSGRGVCRT